MGSDFSSNTFPIALLGSLSNHDDVRQPHRRLQKKNRFNDQNSSSAHNLVPRSHSVLHWKAVTRYPFPLAVGDLGTRLLSTCITLFSTFLWRPLHDYDVKPPNLTFYGGRGHTTTNFPSSFLTWIKSLRIQPQEKSPAFDILSGSK